MGSSIPSDSGVVLIEYFYWMLIILFVIRVTNFASYEHKVATFFYKIHFM